jgi:chaperonin GroES
VGETTLSFIDASTASPLASAVPPRASAPGGADAEGVNLLNEDDRDEEEGERQPLPTEEGGTAKERLVRQVDDINLARYLDQATLDQIGMRVLAEFKIDDNSRADWADKAQKAMDFTLQKTQEKQFPWPRACLSLDTDILTRDGWKPIGDVKVGEHVLSRGADGSADYFPVSRTFRHLAEEMVHFDGKSIDLLVTPNHNMLVEDKLTGAPSFIEAGAFVTSSKRKPYKERLGGKVIPLTSSWAGERPASVYGIPARAYARLLGWYISEGNAIYGKNGSGSSFSIAQSATANPKKYETLRADIAACGFTCKPYPWGFIVHARSMPAMLKVELRGLGKVYGKHIPRHVLGYAPELLAALLDTLVAGDGSTRRRAHQTQEHRVYHTTSALLADQVQEVCQKLGLRGTIAVAEARAGGIINGRAITGAVECFMVSINAKPSVQVLKLKRQLEPFNAEVACVEVFPHHTIYVRRNGKAVWVGNSNIIYPLMTQAAVNFAARTYPALIQNRNVVKGVVIGTDKGTPMMKDGQVVMQSAGPPPMAAPPPQPGPPGTPAPQPAPPQSIPGAGPGQPPPMMANGGQNPPPGASAGQPPQSNQPQQPMWLLEPGEKRMRADRIAEHMSYQLLDEMPEWEPQTDQLLHQLPIVGGAIRKTYRDVVEDRNRSLFVSLMNLVWDYNAPSFEAAARHTEKVMLYPHEILELERAGTEGDDDEGVFLRHEYGVAGGGDVAFGYNHRNDEGDASDPDKPHMFLEQHRRWDLDGDGYPEPYVITVHERSGKVVRIQARYDEDGIKASEDGETILAIKPIEYYTLIPFLPSIDGGSYPIGFGHILKPLNEAINTTLNQMFDAGTLQNTGAGFMASGIGMASGMTSLQVGKFVRVDTKGQNIRDSILPIPFAGPGEVLFKLLGLLMNAGKEVASIQDVLAGDAAIANAPPTTVLALIEQGMKIYTAIHKRVYRAFKAEFAKLYALNRKYIKKSTSYRVGDEEKDIEPHDYRIGGGVEPIADPTMVTDMQKLGRGQLLMSLVENPLMNPKELIKRFLEGANIDRVDECFAPPDPMAPILAQMAMDKAQAELGRERAAELKDQTQAFVNMSIARKNLTGEQQAWVEQQLDFLRYHIEALNVQVKAAAVDHRFAHTTMLEASANADRAAQVAQAGEDGHVPPAPEPTSVMPAPGPAGPFPQVNGPTPPATPPAAPAGPTSAPPVPLPNPAGPGQLG